MVNGRVVSYEAEVGWGLIVGSDGAESPFHGTALMDGSRSVEPGTPVHFVLAPGRSGRWEAADIELAVD